MDKRTMDWKKILPKLVARNKVIAERAGKGESVRKLSLEYGLSVVRIYQIKHKYFRSR